MRCRPFTHAPASVASKRKPIGISSNIEPFASKWKGRNARQLKIERQKETFDAPKHGPKAIPVYACVKCGASLVRIAEDESIRYTGHQEGCSEVLFATGVMPSATVRNHALRFGPAFEGLVKAILRHERKPQSPVRWSTIIRTESTGKGTRLILACGHQIRRTRQPKSLDRMICIACSGEGNRA